ncbi:hypothetical protein [Spirochaeta dissipatitropha]
MKIKIQLQNIEPEFFENLIPIMSDELSTQIQEGKRVMIMDYSEYDDLLTELSALKNHLEEYSPEFQKKINLALHDLMSSWEYAFENTST